MKLSHLLIEFASNPAASHSSGSSARTEFDEPASATTVNLVAPSMLGISLPLYRVFAIDNGHCDHRAVITTLALAHCMKAKQSPTLL